MPTLDEASPNEFTKLLLIGDSGSGKTGSLVSLIKAGYKLRILDLDRGLEPLLTFGKRECPDQLKNVSFLQYADKYRASNTGMQVTSPKAYVDSLKAMQKWDDGTDPAEWGEDYIFVVDSLSSLSKSAFAWAKGLNPSSREKRQWYMAAQESIENMLDQLTSQAFRCHLIMIAHIKWDTDDEGVRLQGNPQSVGAALGPRIPGYFNTMLLTEVKGGANARRVIHTTPTPQIAIKNPAPFSIDKTLPIETGLADIFKKLKETRT